MSNAIRHGNPSCVDIAIAHGDADGIRVAVTDDGIGMATDEMAVRGPARLGLIGMRERVMAMAGSLSIRHGRNGKGPRARRHLAMPDRAAIAARGCGRMRILLVDDHVIVRAGLRNLLMSVPGTHISEAATGRDALLRLRQDRPDLVLLDLNLPGIGGLELLRRMLLEDKAARISGAEHARRAAVRRPCDGTRCAWLPQQECIGGGTVDRGPARDRGRPVHRERIAQELALQTVSPGHGLQDLTERDLEIMRLMAEGMSLAEIADALGIGYKTVANACSQIKTRLGVTRTNELVRLAMTLGIA